MIAESVLDLIGRTPMVKLQRMASGMAEVVLKLESYNPAGSVKDRACLSMIEAAEREGKLEPGDTIVEATSGNTGIGLALVAAVKGYRLIVCMPDDASVERRTVLAHYGADVVLTPARKLMAGAVQRARDIVAKNPNCYMPLQFENLANPDAHRAHTAEEILRDTEGKIDAFVAGVGTGGTITGVGARLKEAIPAIRLVAVEPSASAMLTGGSPGTHAIQGIGAGFVPRVLKRTLLDDIKQCDDKVAIAFARRLAREEGISAGPSGGAATWAALEVAQQLGPGKRVVAIIPDSWDRYQSVDAPDRLDFII